MWSLQQMFYVIPMTFSATFSSSSHRARPHVDNSCFHSISWPAFSTLWSAVSTPECVGVPTAINPEVGQACWLDPVSYPLFECLTLRKWRPNTHEPHALSLMKRHVYHEHSQGGTLHLLVCLSARQSRQYFSRHWFLDLCWLERCCSVLWVLYPLFDALYIFCNEDWHSVVR
jgi:hypothetical protein